ncbi:hypothetical protein J4464_07085 [Candidatus Woesearchaeota archaeon]|nr:hypothetical protein [Candidatus Woesearchaeota archaeon]
MKALKRFTILGVLATVASLQVVHADIIPRFITDNIRNWFTLGVQDWFLKVLLWVLIFCIMYVGAIKIPAFADHKNIVITFAFVIATLSAVMAPADMLRSIAKSYGFLSNAILLLIPVAGGLYLAHTFDKSTGWGRGMRAMIFAIAAWMIGSAAIYVQQTGVGQWSWRDLFDLSTTILFVLAIANLVMAFKGSGSSSSVTSTPAAQAEQKAESQKAQKQVAEADAEEKELEAEEKKEKQAEKKLLKDIEKIRQRDVHEVDKQIADLNLIITALQQGIIPDDTKKKVNKAIASLKEEISREDEFERQFIQRSAEFQNIVNKDFSILKKLGDATQFDAIAVKLKEVMDANQASYGWHTPEPGRLAKIRQALGGPFGGAPLAATAPLKALFDDLKKVRDDVGNAIRTEVDLLKQHQQNYETLINEGVERYQARDRIAVQAFVNAREEKKEQQKILKDLGGVTKMARDWTNHAVHDLEKFRSNTNLNNHRILAWLAKVDKP